jgi:hypothetical protein
MVIMADNEIVREEIPNMAQALQFAASNGECLAAMEVRITATLAKPPVEVTATPAEAPVEVAATPAETPVEVAVTPAKAPKKKGE